MTKRVTGLRGADPAALLAKSAANRLAKTGLPEAPPKPAAAAKKRPPRPPKPPVDHYPLFTALLKREGLPAAREYRFHSFRRWRFDYAWPDSKVAVEIEGGAYVNGGHNRGAGYVENMAKYNSAAIHGWTLLRYTPDQLAGNAVQEIAFVLRERCLVPPKAL